ncbi:hypothetical protein BDK51DRAFT_52251 [Blyttiomyces helicus]|uniref:Uncharacterized protein n=1 Tax=Blyttiomyces helicus TaxID=388810 RepID=A0A4P9WTT0_9FUNG|nr:hypothetical protein BDK51DRAFT_52251 [Blyttiomyces helicus]|eukprot:RKO94496.1 hypothetical protein BDK51DRAFT_52251 [Blyttiomyces helicus]
MSQSQCLEYEMDQKAEMDKAARMETAEVQGLELGLERGCEHGLKLGKKTVALELIGLKCLKFSDVLKCAGPAHALEDPRTTSIKAELIAFCSIVGNGCGNISGAFVSTILAAAAKNYPCGCVQEAQALLDQFLTASGVVALAEAMSRAPINVIPPAQLPGINAPCATTLILSSTTASTSLPSSSNFSSSS